MCFFAWAANKRKIPHRMHLQEEILMGLVALLCALRRKRQWVISLFISIGLLHLGICLFPWWMLNRFKLFSKKDTGPNNWESGPQLSPEINPCSTLYSLFGVWTRIFGMGVDRSSLQHKSKICTFAAKSGCYREFMRAQGLVRFVLCSIKLQEFFCFSFFITYLAVVVHCRQNMIYTRKNSSSSNQTSRKSEGPTKSKHAHNEGRALNPF